jgi:signal recognition particle receptor subunit beta
MMSIATEGDRTLFFDFLPVKVERVNDCTVRLALYTVPGQVFYNATRKLVLQGADGVVFVADSQPEAFDSNRESLQNLEENLLEQGIRMEKFPLVFQWNKRDLGTSLPVDRLRAALNPQGAQDFETCATSGKGVFDALKAITRMVIKDLRAKRIVSTPRPPTPSSPGALSGEDPPASERPGLEDQLRAHLKPALSPRTPSRPMPAVTAVTARALVAAAATAVVTAPAPAPAPAPIPGPAPAARFGPVAALAPRALQDQARAAEAAFAQGDYGACVKVVQESVRKALGFTGEASPVAQAYFLKIDGNDLLRLSSIGMKASPSAEDAAFALFVAMEAFARVVAAGLPGAP